jgi:inner membrane protein
MEINNQENSNSSNTEPAAHFAQANNELKTNSFFDRNKLLLKGFTLAFLALLLLIPQMFIQNLINERAQRKTEVVQEISSKWASEQTVTGPMIALPYLQKVMDADKKVTTVKNIATSCQKI